MFPGRPGGLQLLILSCSRLRVAYKSAACADLSTRCKGNCFGVAGACLPSAYELLETCLPIAEHLFHGQNFQHNVRGAVLMLLVVACDSNES